MCTDLFRVVRGCSRRVTRSLNVRSMGSDGLAFMLSRLDSVRRTIALEIASLAYRIE